MARCHLNMATCGPETMVHGEEHNLVTMVPADACEVIISGAGPLDGVYTENMAGKFVGTNDLQLVYGVLPCFYTFEDPDALGDLASPVAIVGEAGYNSTTDGRP